jgi:NAD(P)H-hydrate repair Nnr-like enzyme with NAD(P)H-hydrate dehydratase domain
MVIGPGLGRDQVTLRAVTRIITRAQQIRLPIILDGVNICYFSK